jgi:hypothetical protein
VLSPRLLIFASKPTKKTEFPCIEKSDHSVSL